MRWREKRRGLVLLLLPRECDLSLRYPDLDSGDEWNEALWHIILITCTLPTYIFRREIL